MARPKSNRTVEIRQFMLNAIPSHPRDVSRIAAAHFGLTRQAANAHLRALVKEQLIHYTGSTRARSYELVAKTHSKTYPIGPQLSEDRVWREWVSPLLSDLPENAMRICEHGLTEMLNNAIDHSEGSCVKVVVSRTAVAVELGIQDDGVGIFRKIKEAFNLDDEKHAVLELSKGKLTTDPARHSGEGIFFTSRMFDTYALLSGTLFLCHMPDDPDSDWLLEDASSRTGTSVSMVTDVHTTRTVREVFDAFSDLKGGTYAFDITHVPVILAKYGDENLVSRSQAKRLVARFERFKKVVLNFDGVGSVGQAFADEVFRVFASEHPDVELGFANANQEVENMIIRAMLHQPR